MDFKNIKLMTVIQWALLLVAVVIIVNYKVDWTYYLLGGLTILFVTINLYSISNAEMVIEVACDSQRYLRVIKRRREKKNKSLYSLQRSFGLIHMYEMEEAKEEFVNCDFNSIKNQKRYYPIYIMTKTRLFFEEKNVEGMKQLLKELEESSYNVDGLAEYVKVYLSMLTNSKIESIEQLKLAIPKQQHRLEIYELEYQLSKLYLETKQYVDSAFVADFISKKKYKIIYIELCKDLFIEANKFNILE